MNLIDRCRKLINTFHIDPDNIVRINDITTLIGDNTYIVGTVVKHVYRDSYLYTILFASGRYKVYKCDDSKTDIVRVIRMMKKNSFTHKQISEILSISENEVSSMFVKNQEVI